MTDAPPTNSSGDRVELLERRARRERAARLEAERIAEEGLRRLYEVNQELDRRVLSRTAELDEARAVALSAAGAKTEFLANLSHEVGTPLQTILAAIELTGPDDPDDRDRLGRAAEATAGLHQLFRNLLELAQCETGTVSTSLASTPMSEVSERLERRWADRLAAAGLLLTPEATGEGVVDPDRLVQIGDILLDNALRFSDSGPVHLTVVAGERGIVLAVADGGPGLDDSQLDRILEPFVQVSGGNDRPVGGAGIGLALARGLATHMGGLTSVRSNDRGGLTVMIELPPDPVGTGPGSAP